VACAPDAAPPIEQTMRGHGAEEVHVHA